MSAGSVLHADRRDGDVFTLRPTTRQDPAVLRIDGSPGDRGLRRVAALSAACGRALPGAPVTAFGVSWQTFQENHPFFAAKGIDRAAVCDRSRRSVHAGMTGDQLFAVLRDMLAPLYGAHVVLSAGPTRLFGETRPAPSPPAPIRTTGSAPNIRQRDRAHRGADTGRPVRRADAPAPQRLGSPRAGRGVPHPRRPRLRRHGHRALIAEPAFTAGEFAEHRDSAFDRAVAWLINGPRERR